DGSEGGHRLRPPVDPSAPLLERRRALVPLRQRRKRHDSGLCGGVTITSMAINIGPTLRRRREWARLTQQELVDHTRMDRSASYVSALETGRSSPTLLELEQLS